MTTRVSALTALLLALFAVPAHAYVDPTTSRTFFQFLSVIFILVSAGYVFLKHQIAALFASLWRLLKRLAS